MAIDTLTIVGFVIFVFYKLLLIVSAKCSSGMSDCKCNDFGFCTPYAANNGCARGAT